MASSAISAPQQSGSQNVSLALDSAGSGVWVIDKYGSSHHPVFGHNPHLPVGIISPPPPPVGICPTPLPSPLLMSAAGLAIAVGLVFRKRKDRPTKA